MHTTYLEYLYILATIPVMEATMRNPWAAIFFLDYDLGISEVEKSKGVKCKASGGSLPVRYYLRAFAA